MNYCQCVDPDHGGLYRAYGRPGHIVDYEVCEFCTLPIQGTQQTHVEDDDEED